MTGPVDGGGGGRPIVRQCVAHGPEDGGTVPPGDVAGRDGVPGSRRRGAAGEGGGGAAGG